MRHPKGEDSNRRARAAAARRHHRHLDLGKRESLKRQRATDGVVARSSNRRPVTNVTGIRNSPQDLQVIGRRAANCRLFAQRQDAMIVDALGESDFKIRCTPSSGRLHCRSLGYEKRGIGSRVLPPERYPHGLCREPHPSLRRSSLVRRSIYCHRAREGEISVSKSLSQRHGHHLQALDRR